MAPRRDDLQRPAAVLWDMDGTIVDTEPYWIECEYELVAEFGGHWDERKAHSLVGLDLRDSARILRDQGGVTLPLDDIVNRLLDGVIARVKRRVPWRPGARELLAALQRADIPCALVTMSWSRFANAVVDALPPGSFSAVITGDMVRNGKPHPEPYLAAANALGVHPYACVAIEDSPNGMRSAVAAGCRTIVVPNVVDVPPSRDYTVVESLATLDPRLVGLRRLAPRDPTRVLRRSPREAPVPAGVQPPPVSPRRGTPARAPRRPRLRPLVALAVLFGLGAGVAYAVRGGDGPPPLPVIAMSGWAPYWVLEEATETVARDGSMFQEISPFWFEARGATDVQFSGRLNAERIAPFMEAARATGARIVPAVVDVMDEGGMAAVLADPTRRAAHVETLLELARTWEVDGLDIDYERFAFRDSRTTWEATRPNWIAFITELADGLHASGRILTVAVPPIYDTERTPQSGYWVYDYASMGEVVDRIRIMAYDYSTSEPGPIAPIDWVRVAVRAAKEAVDDDTKIVLGIPLYGRNWVISTSGECPDDAPGTVDPNLREIDELVAKYGAVPMYDELTGDETFTYQRPVSDSQASCVQTRRVHYVSTKGARARVDIARQERIGGVAFWAIGFDTPEVWEGIRDLARLPGT